jgi:hypothetical protein
MDKQLFHFYRKNTTYLFVVAALLIAVSVLATVLVLIPPNMLIEEAPILATIILWIALLFGTLLGEGKKVAMFNLVVSITGFICSFVLAVSVFIQDSTNALSLFLFWISQILNAVFILSTYFSVQAYLETKREPVKKAVVRKRKTATKKQAKQ